jgi:phenylpropionate dioxygenase-like ring-hydroxylating dioxygenase large terminal subunit
MGAGTTNPVVGKHGELDISLSLQDGVFYAWPQGRDHRVTDKSLDGLKKKLDNIVRASARAQAISLPAVVLEFYAGWRDDVTKATWRTGTFAGINAHTGEISFDVKNSKERLKLNHGWFFRTDHPALPEIRELVEQRLATAKAAADATKKLDAALERHGFKPHIGDSRNKLEAAARVEQDLIDVLAPPTEPTKRGAR